MKWILRIAAIDLLLIAIMVASSGCATKTGWNPETKRIDVMVRVGLEDYTIGELTMSLPGDPVDIEATSDALATVTELILNGADAGSGLVGDLIAWIGGWFKMGNP